jgi:hypothetical protein
LVRARGLSVIGEPAIVIYDNALNLGDRYSVTLLLCPDKPDSPCAIEIRKNSNDQWNFCGFVFNCIEKGILVRGDVVVCDNASVHHGRESEENLQEILDAAGVSIVFLPAYSPELNPCELVFAHVKRQFRDYRRGGNFKRKIRRAFANVPFRSIIKYYNRCINHPK